MIFGKTECTFTYNQPLDYINESGSFTSKVINTGYFVSKGTYFSLPTQEIRTERAPEDMDFGKAINGVIEDGELELESVVDSSGNEVKIIDNNKIKAKSGTYTINYFFTDYTTTEKADGSTYISTIFLRLTYVISLVYNHYPLKKWTITDVINRTFDLIIPLKDGDFPKFRLKGVKYDENGKVKGLEEGSIAEEYDKIISPEFGFTKMTLREMLQQVGGFVHAEPRITEKKTDEYGKKYYEVDFDKYGGLNKSHLGDRRLVSASFNVDINNWCTGLDSSADNLVCQLDYAQGVIVEPFYGGYKSLRAERTTVRLGEDNDTFIPTSFPLYKVGSETKVVCDYIPGIEKGEDDDWDITPYIFEKSDYDGLLSSYEGVYPYSKAYGLYYTQGEKNIRGLFFKAEHAVSEVFHNYAIINILRAVTGKDLNDLKGQDLMQIGFSVVYLPISTARVHTNKQTIVKGIQRTIAYNQSANFIETRYYGENLKGTIARLGNVEKVYTFHLPFLSDIPKIGTLYDENYYISTVSVEILPTLIKCTVGLSKDFNRLSQYIGVNSIKRMWEVSEKQIQDRQSLYIEYLKISKTDKKHDDKVCFNPLGVADILKYTYNSPVSDMLLKTYDKSGERIQNLDFHLPVVVTPLGNSLVFFANTYDNYSAGQKIVKVDGDKKNNDNVTGYWGTYVPYNDYYGRAYYVELQFLSGIKVVNESKKDIMNTLPQTASDTIQGAPFVQISKWKYRKDSREAPQFGYELCAVTDDDKIIIGSALFKNCGIANTTPKNSFKVYGFFERLNTIQSKVDLSKATYIGDYTIEESSDYVAIVLPESDKQFMSWAIVSDKSEKTQKVEDEDGNEEYQTLDNGSELIIGGNEEYPSGQKLYLTIKRNIGD